MDASTALALAVQALPTALGPNVIRSGFKRCGLAPGEPFHVGWIDGVIEDMRSDPITLHLSTSTLPDLFAPTVFMPPSLPPQLEDASLDSETKAQILSDYVPALERSLNDTIHTLRRLQDDQTRMVRCMQAGLQAIHLANRESARMGKTRAKLASCASSVQVLNAIARRQHEGEEKAKRKAETDAKRNLVQVHQVIFATIMGLAPGSDYKLPSKVAEAKAFLSRLTSARKGIAACSLSVSKPSSIALRRCQQIKEPSPSVGASGKDGQQFQRQRRPPAQRRTRYSKSSPLNRPKRIIK